jgi:hypothetical protein
MRWLLALLVVASFVGCKKKRDGSSDFAYAFGEQMCACKDMACANKVMAEFEKESPKEVTPSMVEAGKRGGDCFEKLQKISGSDAPAMPATPAKRQVDALMTAARAVNKELGIHEMQASYVEADGTLDETDGVLSMQFGATPIVVDNPKRKTGAPVAPANRPESCPLLSFTKAAGWTRTDEYCRDAAPYPKCFVETIWKKAIAAGAPKDALAVIRYSYVAEPKWSFVISDAPRGVAISQSYNDDCEPVAEKVP